MKNFRLRRYLGVYFFRLRRYLGVYNNVLPATLGKGKLFPQRNVTQRFLLQKTATFFFDPRAGEQFPVFFPAFYREPVKNFACGAGKIAGFQNFAKMR